MADVRMLSEKAPLVFRGRVTTVTPVNNPDPGGEAISIADIQVDRWYRGEGSRSASVSFTFTFPGGFGSNGHDCIDFRPGTYWIVFAVEKVQHLDLIDDCEGALAVSPLLGPKLRGTDWLPQMEADFLAGLADQHSDARLLSIQRLGGLKLPSSRDALHRLIEANDPEESEWAIYAALRTGDATVLPAAKELLAVGDMGLPASGIAYELRNVVDPSAVPELVSILNSAPGETARVSALIALGRKLKDPQAVPALAAHLSDPNANARYNAMDGLKNITHEDACTLIPDWTENDVPVQISRCKQWWDQVGHLRNWN